MRRFIDLAVLLVVLGIGAYVAHTHPAQVEGIRRLAESKFAPCSSPITYSVGSIDPNFGISKTNFVADLKAAEAIWEKSGKNLFTYEESGGEVTVNLIYDNRQAATDKLRVAGIEIGTDKSSYNELKSRYDTLSTRIRTEKADYDSRVATLNRDQDAYNAEVARWNKRGGAPQSAYQQLQQQKAALESEFANINALKDTLNSNIDTLNALATAINQLIVQLNLNVEQYNQTGATLGEIEEGEYRLSGGIQTIDIYEYSDKVKLVRVLAHELGHARGLEHVADSQAIMYKLNNGTSLTATKADLSELERVCASGLLH